MRISYPVEHRKIRSRYKCFVVQVKYEHSVDWIDYTSTLHSSEFQAIIEHDKAINNDKV